MRTPLVITVAVVAVLALVAVFVFASGDDDETSGSTTTSSGDTTTSTGPDDSTTTSGPGGPGGGGGGDYDTGHENLVVVEQGFQVVQDQESGREALSVGAIIENTSDRVAVICDITVEAYDDAGEQVALASNWYVSWILPGEPYGLGLKVTDFAGEPAEVRVVFSEITWDDPANYGEVPVDDIDTFVDSIGRPTTSFSTTSTFEEELGGYAWTIYRNADGEIVGGDGHNMDSPLTPGEAVDEEVTSSLVVEDLDESQTEVYIEAQTTDCAGDQPGEANP